MPTFDRRISRRLGIYYRNSASLPQANNGARHLLMVFAEFRTADWRLEYRSRFR